MSAKKPKLAVIGCSFSDLCRVDRCYGDYAAELLGLEYLHLAKGASSNDRSWRVLTKHILDGTITSDDIVVLQYTDIHRREFPSYGLNYIDYYDPEKGKYNGPNEKYHSSINKDDIYFVSHYKSGSSTWQSNHCDKEIHSAYEKNCSVWEFDCDHFYTRHKQFEALCEIHNIKLVVFWIRYTDKLDPGDVLGNYSRENLLHERVYWSTLDKSVTDSFVLGYNGGDTAVWDGSHLNDKGHRFTAERLAEHIRSKGLH